MKTAIAILATVFAATAFAADTPKTADVKPAVAPAPATATADKKDAKAPVKSTVVKDEKAAAPAVAKPASK